MVFIIIFNIRDVLYLCALYSNLQAMLPVSDLSLCCHSIPTASLLFLFAIIAR